MSIRSKKLALVLTATTIAALGIAAVGQRTRSAADETASSTADAPAVEPSSLTFGHAKLSLALPPGATFTSVAYAVQSSRNIILARGTFDTKNAGGTTVSQEIALPAGAANTVTFVGSSNADGVTHTTYLGRQTFDVAANLTSEVSATAAAPAANNPVGAGATLAALGTVPLAVAPADAAEACRSCQLSSAQGICDSPNVTATSNTNPQTGEQTGVGWGCGTLADAKAQAACLALLRCLNANACGRKGENPIMGCYCGAASAEACLAGDGVTGACIVEYRAAATASGDPQAAGATVAQLSRFIATWASDPTTPVGLADNIKHCAMETNCDACESL